MGPGNLLGRDNPLGGWEGEREGEREERERGREGEREGGREGGGREEVGESTCTVG